MINKKVDIAVLMKSRDECIKIANFLDRHGFCWCNGEPLTKNVKPWTFYQRNGYYLINYYKPHGVMYGNIRNSGTDDFQRLTLKTLRLLYSSLLSTKQERKESAIENITSLPF